MHVCIELPNLIDIWSMFSPLLFVTTAGCASRATRLWKRMPRSCDLPAQLVVMVAVYGWSTGRYHVIMNPGTTLVRVVSGWCDNCLPSFFSVLWLPNCTIVPKKCEGVFFFGGGLPAVFYCYYYILLLLPLLLL